MKPSALLAAGAALAAALPAAFAQNPSLAGGQGGTLADTPFWQDYHDAYPLGGAAENDVRAVAFDRTGRLWAATANGVRVRYGKGWAAPDGGPGLGATYSLLRDRQGNLWAGTWKGLYRLGDDSVALAALPGKTIAALALDADGSVWAAGPHGIWKRKPDGGLVALKGRWHQAIRAILPEGGKLWIGCASGLYVQDVASGQPAHRLGTPDTLLSSNIKSLTALPDGTIAVGSTGGVDFYKGGKRVGSLSQPQGMPCRDVRHVAADRSGRLWIATRLGVARYDKGVWSLRHSRRWLLSDDARAVAIGPDGAAWVATGGGVDAIRRTRMTLESKAGHFLKILRARHLRAPGLTGPAVLVTPGDLSKSFIEDDDNDGEHTGMYLAMESMRYAVTKDPEARANAKAAFHAMEVLQSVTGTNHFIARSVLPVGTAPRHEVDRTFTPEEIADSLRTDPREKPITKRWVPSADGKWLWKRDASSDEIDGHLFGYTCYYDLAADPAEKKRVAALVDKIVGGIVDHGFVLQDIDGKATRWGNWSPASLNGDPNWNEERYGNSTEILAHLGAAYHITGKAKFRDAAKLLVERHGYAANMRRMGYVTPSERTHINDELLSMVFPNLLRHLPLESLRGDALAALRQWHATNERDRIPFYDFVYNTFSGRTVPLDGALFTLRDWPLDMIEWTVDNRSREDVTFDRTPGLDEDRLTKLLPRSEMGLCMWDQEPYKPVIGRGGDREDRPTDWLLAYWMGRWWGLIGGAKR